MLVCLVAKQQKQEGGERTMRNQVQRSHILRTRGRVLDFECNITCSQTNQVFGPERPRTRGSTGEEPPRGLQVPERRVVRVLLQLPSEGQDEGRRSLHPVRPDEGRLRRRSGVGNPHARRHGHQRRAQRPILEGRVRFRRGDERKLELGRRHRRVGSRPDQDHSRGVFGGVCCFIIIPSLFLRLFALLQQHIDINIQFQYLIKRCDRQ